MRRLVAYIQSLFVRHTWDDPTAERRTCTTCGRRETFDEVASVEGSVWNCEWEGYPRSHLRGR